MAATGSENSHTPWQNFNAAFLAILIVCGLLSSFFLLYFNRVFASIVSSIIRTFVWHRYRIYIDVQALQLSLLGGRLFFTGFRYHGNNETILVQHGHITWSYWQWRVKDVKIGGSKKFKRNSTDGYSQVGREGDENEHSTELPCRVNVKVSGLEWFIYNRSPVYDSVLSRMSEAAEPGECAQEKPDQSRQRLQKAPHQIEEQLNKLDSRRSADERHADDSHEDKRGTDTWETKRPGSSGPAEDRVDGRNNEDQLPLLLQLLPIHLECDKGAIVMGNENTKAILVVKTKSLTGEIDASDCQTPDLYRQIFKIRLDHPVVEMKDNEDFKEDQLTRAVKDKQAALNSEPVQRRSFFRRQRRRVLGTLRNMVPYWRTSVESFSATGTGAAAQNLLPGSNHWQGLSRYMNDDDGDDKIRWSSVEYAAVTTLIDSPEATLTIFWDVPGKVTRTHESFFSKEPDQQNNINGAPPPAWAIHLNLGGGFVNYGPWADRHRADLQRVFNPALSKDMVPAQKLPVGADRVPTEFKLYVEFDKEVTFRIPTREDSKNWRYKKVVADLRQHRKQERRRGRGRNHEKGASSAAEQRPYGWLDVKIAPNATVSYNMDQVAGPMGFSTTLNVDLPSTEVSTSVNHGVLWRSGALRVSCDMSSPLKWNTLRNWRFDVESHSLELFILRDHIFLLTDLINDWGSGPPQDYLLFTPYKYLINFDFRDLKLYINVNDMNIVNNPTDFEENSYLVLSSPNLKADTSIALDVYRPSKNVVPFNVRAETATFALHVPPWNTQAAFSTSTEMGHLESLILDGEYHYHATTSSSNTDTLVLNVSGQSPVAYIQGFFIRYFLQLKDNYFGDHVHFRTLDEYQEMLRLKTSNPDAEVVTRPPPKKVNDMDVILCIRTDDPKILFPANLYSVKRHLTVEGALLSVDLRFTNYYMDLNIATSPLSLSLGSDEDGMISPESTTSSTQMFLDGLVIYGNRLFGLPPTEPTYMCNWDVSAGTLTGECTTDFLAALVNVGKAFAFSLDDDENALVPYSTIISNDVTFLRVFVKSMQLWLHVQDAAFLLSSDSIDVNYNDWARTHYSKRADIKIPDLQIACVNSESAARHKSRLHGKVLTDALLRTSVQFAFIGRKYDFTDKRKIQQELVRREDQRTHRTGFLLVPNIPDLEPFVPEPCDIPAQSVPLIPPPTHRGDVISETTPVSASSASHRSRQLRQKSSFISFASESRSKLRRRASMSSSWSRAESAHKVSKSASRQAADRLPTMRQREYSASPSHSSTLDSIHGDFKDRKDPSHDVVAFSSQFFAPYFPLKNVHPDTKEAKIQSIEFEDEDLPNSSTFSLDDIDPDTVGQDAAYNSFIIELPTGITAFVNAAALRHIASLLNALQPTDPEDILDSLQTSAMSDVFALQKRARIPGKINDLVVRVPQVNVRFLNCSDLDSPEPSQEEQDQYDFSVTKLALAARSETRRKKTDTDTFDESRMSFQLRIDSAEASAAERITSLDDTQAAVRARIDNVLVSMGSKDVTYLDADVGALRISTSSGRVQYFAALIHRTNMLATEMGTLFSTVISQPDKRLKLLTHDLMSEGKDIPDPSFIVRPSAVLRAATDHLRNHDSWKLMGRLRQVWTVVGNDVKERLSLLCASCNSPVPNDARQAVAKAFENWRGWDLEDVAYAALMNSIFGKPVTAKRAVPGREQPMAVLRLHETELVLDPGPKQNQIFAVDITARFHTKMVQPEEPNGRRSSEKRHSTEKRRSTESSPLHILNIYCSQAGINLNWELLELVDDILQLYQSPDPPETPGQPSSLPSEATLSKPMSFQVVFHLAQGSIGVETVNLKSEVQSDDLKLSVIMSKKRWLTDTNAIFACNAVVTKLRSHQQALATLRLQQPSVFVSHELQLGKTKSFQTIKAAASSQDLKLNIKQDPIVLTEVFDTLVRDELAQLYQLQKQIPQSPRSSSAETQKQKISDHLSSFRVNLAMFLNTYTITVPLLRSLTYTISGVVARVAMAANFGKEIIFDFDIKENSHDMQIKVNNIPRSISLLQLPPTNGRVTTQMGREQTLSVFASVELIQLDASAVYTLLAALNRPEVSNALNDIQEQASIVQEHVEEVFGRPQAPAPKIEDPNKPKLVYVVHTTLAGIEIFGSTPIKSNTEQVAHLSFGMDRIHLELANRLEPKGPILENPEVRINLRQTLFDIQKGSAETMTSCGNVTFGVLITATTKDAEDGTEQRFFHIESDGFEANVSAETVSTFVDVLGYMGDKIKDLDTTREVEYLQKRLRQSRPRITINDEEQETSSDIFDSFLATIMYTFEVRNIQLSWLVAPGAAAVEGQEDLVCSFQRIGFSRAKKSTAKLTIEDFRLQMVAPGEDKVHRSPNSALLPEVIFNVAFVSSLTTRRLAFQAVGKTLDLHLTSGFIVPAANLVHSIGQSAKNVAKASANWTPIITKVDSTKKPTETRPRPAFGSKRMESILVDADFAGAVVYLSSKKAGAEFANRPPMAGKYGQFSVDDSGSSSTVLRSPGLAWKIEYRDDGQEDPALYGEIRINASRNVLYPSVVPLIMDISSSIKEVINKGNDEGDEEPPTFPTVPTSADNKSPKSKSTDDENILTTDPSAVLGKTKLNVGLRICRQDFSLSCQPIARVAASASFDDIYLTVNTVHSLEHGNFFAISGAFSNLQTTVQHVYSRESTGSFAVDSIVLSLMNSKHVSGKSGVSAILKFSPMNVAVNAKQLQDFLLFYEIWIPKSIRQSAGPTVPPLMTQTSQGHLVQRYQQVAATAAFPWTATISMTALNVSVDLGQSLGKTMFAITEFWVSSKKTSDWEQNLCVGFRQVGAESTGRMSGFFTLQDFKLRTSIEWPERQAALNETPRVQASVAFSHFRLKAAFDYQAFLVADTTSMELLMYNVRRTREGSGDRVVAICDGDAVRVFGTTTSAAQGIALWQAIQKLHQERVAAFKLSLRDIEKFLKRRSYSGPPAQIRRASSIKPDLDKAKPLITLDTDVVVTLKALNIGVFPSTFSDQQVFKLEALNSQARFAASMDQSRIHSILGMTLGQLRIGLAGVRQVEAPKSAADLSVEDVVASATNSRGGTILKVPKVEAIMQTWQIPDSRTIDYIFKSAFEGKVEVGWNYSRISYIRGMWANHSKALAATWGRQLPGMSAIKVTGVPELPSVSSPSSSSITEGGVGDKENDKSGKAKEQTKITAEVNVPLSKYEYVALEPPIIETPQLRDMGEATPPLEWIGLHRDRLPNLTHQIVIVSLLELAGEVGDLYERILGSS